MWTTIVSFTVAAVLGIFAILTAGDFDDDVGRVLGTTFTVGVMGLALLCYAAVADRPVRWLGLAGAAVALVPFVLTLFLIWDPDFWDSGDGLWRGYFSALTVAATLAQICLLIGLTGDRRGGIRIASASTIGVASFVAALIVIPILGDVEPGFGYLQLVAIAAILDALGTITVIALRVFGGAEPSRDDRPPTTPHQPENPPLPADLNAWLHEQALSHETTRDALIAQAVQEYTDQRHGRTP